MRLRNWAVDRERRRRRGVDCGLASYLSRQTDSSGRQKFGNSNQIIGSGGQDEEPFNQAAAIAPIGEIPPFRFAIFGFRPTRCRRHHHRHHRRSAAAAPTRRPAPGRDAPRPRGPSAPPRQGIKSGIRQPEMSERENGVEPPARSIAAGGEAVDPVAANSTSAIDRPAAEFAKYRENRRLAPVEQRRARCGGAPPPPRDNEQHRASRNVGERARR